MLPFFLEQARELRALADPSGPVFELWREAAYCHVLFAAGKGHLAVARLRFVFRTVAGTELEPLGPNEAHGVAVALLGRLRTALERPNAA